jgi:hypothetical protein
MCLSPATHDYDENDVGDASIVSRSTVATLPVKDVAGRTTARSDRSLSDSRCAVKSRLYTGHVDHYAVVTPLVAFQRIARCRLLAARAGVVRRPDNYQPGRGGKESGPGSW